MESIENGERGGMVVPGWAREIFCYTKTNKFYENKLNPEKQKR